MGPKSRACMGIDKLISENKRVNLFMDAVMYGGIVGVILGCLEARQKSKPKAVLGSGIDRAVDPQRPDFAALRSENAALRSEYEALRSEYAALRSRLDRKLDDNQPKPPPKN